MGYKNINNAFAVEFDTYSNPENNDPTPAYDRHISIIAQKGANQANEANSMAHNDNVINFNSKSDENYKANAKFKIKYMEGKLSVYINDALQLAYKNDFNIGKQIGAKPNTPLYMGFTAATGVQT